MRERRGAERRASPGRARAAAPEWGISILFFRWRSHEGSIGGAGILGGRGTDEAGGSGQSASVHLDALRIALSNM